MGHHFLNGKTIICNAATGSIRVFISKKDPMTGDPPQAWFCARDLLLITNSMHLPTNRLGHGEHMQIAFSGSRMLAVSRSGLMVVYPSTREFAKARRTLLELIDLFTPDMAARILANELIDVLSVLSVDEIAALNTP